MTTDSRTTRETSSITGDSTVDAVIAMSPAATAILDAHNIDTCCGGRSTLNDAAVHAHVDPAMLIGLLSASAPATTPVTSNAPLPVASCSCGCR